MERNEPLNHSTVRWTSKAGWVKEARIPCSPIYDVLDQATGIRTVVAFGGEIGRWIDLGSWQGDFLSDGNVLCLDRVMGHMDVTITFILKKVSESSFFKRQIRSRTEWAARQGRRLPWAFCSRGLQEVLSAKKAFRKRSSKGSRNECSWGRPETEKQERQWLTIKCSVVGL